MTTISTSGSPRAAMLDLDSHIQPCPETYELVAGEIGAHYRQMFHDLLKSLPEDRAERVKKFAAPEIQEWNDSTVWTRKGSSAPGAVTAEGRLRTLDHMGVSRSLIFSDPGVQATAMGAGPLALPTMRHWNDFITEFSSLDPDRLRGVAILNTVDHELALNEAKRVLGNGGRAFVLPSSIPPGHASPARKEMDSLWGLLEEADATVCLHAGGEEGFLASQEWDDGVEHLKFDTIDYSAEGEQISPYLFSTMSLAPQNFVTLMVLGGVFERFPGLRFAAIELGAHWLAPTALHLDNVYKIFSRRFQGVLSMLPSEYIRQNIRVTPYRIENVADYVDRYGMAECYCYSSDFPHPEGGNEPVKEFASNVSRLGEAFSSAFFSENGEWVLPQLSR
ncbi:MAG: amidohydrolase family protein [Gammaproteobacteria bacterium]|jgi:predicted TIM-barrel fold metal-dependent hydrolase